MNPNGLSHFLIRGNDHSGGDVAYLYIQLPIKVPLKQEGYIDSATAAPILTAISGADDKIT